MKLSNIIYKYSTKGVVISIKTKKGLLKKRIRIDAQIYTAILAQESMYRVEAKNCIKGYNRKKLSEKNITEVCADFGIGQINYVNIEAYNLDLKKLLSDMEYSVRAGAIILAEMKYRYGRRESDYWSRYNSSKRPLREVYKQLVVPYL